MGKIFNIDSPVFQLLSKIADKIILNLLFLVACLPVVTIGAAVTALYDVTIRLDRDDVHVWKTFKKSFLSNFKQSTFLWLLLLVSGCMILFCLLFYLQTEVAMKGIGAVTAAVLLLLWALICVWAFPLQARFENTLLRTLKNAFFCGLSYLPRSIAAALVNLIPVLVFFFFPTVFFDIFFVWILLWFSAAASIHMFILKKPFLDLEKMSSETK